MNTKQKILDTSLEMFSKRGFSSVSVREISNAIGVRESALYKHFKNKQSVFNTLVENYIEKSNKFMKKIGVTYTNDLKDLENKALDYAKMEDKEFLKISISVFKEFLLKPKVIQFWRMVSIEQYNNKKMADLFNKLLFKEPIEFQESFFRILISKGFLKNIDPSILALEFYTPALMFYLRILPFEKDSDTVAKNMVLFENHINHFRETYFIKG